MTVYLAWGITGAGQFLSETVAMMMRVKTKYEVKISTFLSLAAEEVVRMYGLSSEVAKISPGGYYEEMLASNKEGASSVTAGRFQARRYTVLVVSPCTSNTVAKIAHGISDTLITNAVAHAMKGVTPVLILPTDYGSDESETCLPYVVRREICTGCGECLPACSHSAISIVNGKARIVLQRCVGCGDCLRVCPVRAITFMEKLWTRGRRIDAENVQKLRQTEGIQIYEYPTSLEHGLMKFIEGL